MEDSLIGILVVSGIVWIIVAILVGKAGASRKIGFAGAFYASLLLSPILAMLFVLASDKTGASVITKGDAQAIWIPLFVIACIAGLIGILAYVENVAWEKEYAERQRKEMIVEARQKLVSDSLLHLRIVNANKPKPVVCPRYEPNAWDILNGVTYNSNKSVTLGGIEKVTFSSSQIPALIKIVEKAKKIENACDTMGITTEVRKYIGTVGQTKFYFVKDYKWSYQSGEIKWWSDYDEIKINVDLFTTNRDRYYEELRLWNEKKRKDQEALAKL